MSYQTDIRNALRVIFNSMMSADGMFSATVTAVDVSKRSCSVTTISNDVETELPNVWLMADIDDGQLIVPKIGSVVLIANNSKLQPFVVMFSELDSIMWVVGNSQIKVTDSLVKFNDGSNGGLVKSAEVSDSDNKIIQDIMTLKPLLAAVVSAAAASPVTPWEIALSLAFAPIAGYASQVLTPTVKTTFEDSKVTH